VKHEPVAITAGVIAETIGAPHNTLSSHLAIFGAGGSPSLVAQAPNHHLSFGCRRLEVLDRVAGQGLLRRTSGALQPGGQGRRGVLRAEGKAREEGPQAEDLSVLPESLATFVT
jgi:hypothetical protein